MFFTIVLPPPITSNVKSNAHERPLSSQKGTALTFQAEYLSSRSSLSLWTLSQSERCDEERQDPNI